jgi:hypothetical protein
MRRAITVSVTALVLSIGSGVAAFCAADPVFPLSSDLARVEFNAARFTAQTAGLSDFDETARERTIRALSDEEVARLMRDNIDSRWNDRASRNDVAERDPFAMAAAVGSALQRLAGFWDPRLAGVLLWLFVLALMVRAPRETRAKAQN